MPELVVVNKIDAADPFVLNRLVRNEPGCLLVCAKSGAVSPSCSTHIQGALPRPDVEVNVVVPYDRGDLVSRVHVEGEVLAEQHTGDGTMLRARVGQALAAELASVTVTATA